MGYRKENTNYYEPVDSSASGEIDDIAMIIRKVAGILLKTVCVKWGKRPKLSQRDMAVLIGTSREMIGKSLESLRVNGIIGIDRNRLVIKDKRRLQIWSSSAPLNPAFY